MPLPRPLRATAVLPLAVLAALSAWAVAGCDDAGSLEGLPPAAPLPGTFPGRLPNAASFLMNQADWRIMNGLSEGLTEAEFDERLAACIANRDDTIALFLTNRGDGTPPVTSFYAGDAYGTEVDSAKVAFMRTRLERCRAAPLKVHLWVWADDSGFGAIDDSVNVAHLARCVALFDDLADAWCTGLELDEVFEDRDRVARLTLELKRLTPKPVGVHFTTLDRWEWTVHAGADILFGQYGFGLSADEIRKRTARTIRRLDGRAEFWAWEYHLSSRSDEAKALGDAAMSVPGCRGTGNGRTLRDPAAAGGAR